MKHSILILFALLGAACGGGGGGNDGGSPNSSSSDNFGPVTINEPINGNGTYSTKAPSLEIRGSAYVAPDDVDCVSVQPVQLSIEWSNAATGQSGTGGIGSRCETSFLGTLPVTRWGIAYGQIDLASGANEITIRVSGGGRSGTARITVNRIEDTQPPSITSRYPAPDAQDVPVNRKLTVAFNEEMRRGSLTGERFLVEDAVGLTVNGFLEYDGYNNQWTFDPQFTLGYSTTYTVTIGGGVEDRYGGNTMGEDVTWSFTTAPNPDITPPEVTDIAPAPNLTCVGPDAHVFARFSERLDSATVNDQTFTLTESGGAPVDASVLYDGDSAELGPLLPLIPGAEYEATLSADIADLAGNRLGTHFNWSFRTTDAADSGRWAATNLNAAPIERYKHTAVWTGSEMIVWGGRSFIQGTFAETNTGGRYDPGTDTWLAVNTDGVSPRQDHTAVWTGTEMIIWGGNSDTGGRYDPGTDTWQATTRDGAPTPRVRNIAAWTGSEMIVWGGMTPSGTALGSGARYNPSTDTWTPMSGDSAPSRRHDAVHVWTGTELIVFGGSDVGYIDTNLTDGARYNPVTDTWTPLPPADVREFRELVAVWTGTEMILWDGGSSTNIVSGGFQQTESTLRLYDPASDAWRATASLCEPYLGSSDMHAHWTGNRMFVWANKANGGYFYHPASDDWQPIATSGAPVHRIETATVWAGDRFILWGGSETVGGFQGSGFVYTP